MRLGRIFVLLILVTFGCYAAERSALLPDPPQQNVVWTNQAAVQTNLSSAAETLFAQGFPNPNGCDYRDIEVRVSGVWGAESALVKTRG